MVISSSEAGAEIITFFAPAVICFLASAAFVKIPVDSTTTSTPNLPQGILAGSRSALTAIVFPPTVIDVSVKVTALSRRPRIESYLSRWASVSLSVRSFIPTISKSAPDSREALRKFLPILPKPLTPTFNMIILV
ncbi:unannotated protein [freshwater metagenome]|uniref:Unannotated protein n=1 Tax=freshwater metagenome TaxID=449393 RepID=A0A6J6V656_9ZZZZ